MLWVGKAGKGEGAVPVAAERGVARRAFRSAGQEPDEGNVPVRRLAALLLLLAGVLPAQAQWQIFAENPPKPGTWARYRYETVREGKVASTSELSFSTRPGPAVGDKACVWFTVEPVAWLGSREQAPLRLLLRADLGRAQASRLIENAEEIVFSNPVKGSYHMTREDIAWV